jgi:pimeloyl-ACP methyl ester carboxylesterase
VTEPAEVVLLPSLGRGADDFDHLAAALGRAAFMPIAFGPSLPTIVPRAATLHDLAALVIDRLDDAGVGRFHLVGHAFGQRLARCLVADVPERVATLTMLAAGGLVPMPSGVAASLTACFDLSLSPDEHLDHVRRVFFAPGNDPAVWRDGWLPDVAAYQSAAVRRTRETDWNRATASRVLVVQGLQDACAVPENGRRYVAAHSDVATLVEIDGAGHALLPEQPDAVAAAVLDFLRAARTRDD